MVARAPRFARAGWFAPPLFLLAVLAGAWVAFARPESPFALVIAGLAFVPATWVLVSALWPATADRRCPACGKSELERLDKDAAHGLRCRACAWRDEHASAWLLAEEEGAVDEIVRRRREREDSRVSAVDSPHRPG